MRPVFLIAPFSLLFISFSCQRAYTIDNFEERTQDHQIIAVLPFELTYTGRLPKGWTEA